MVEIVTILVVLFIFLPIAAFGIIAAVLIGVVLYTLVLAVYQFLASLSK